MVAGCGKKILKYILFALNIVIFLLALAGVIGCAVFIAKPGIWKDAAKTIEKLEDLDSLVSPSTIRMGLYVLLAASVLILVISFLGCCGAWKECKWLLVLYATALLIILAVEVAAFVVAIVAKEKVENQAKEVLTDAKEKNKSAYEDLENLLECCGVNDGDPCINSTITPEPKIGCYNKILDIFKENYPLVLAISIITVIVEISLVCFACCLCTGLGEEVA